MGESSISAQVVVAITDKALLENPMAVSEAIARLHRHGGIPEGEVGRISLVGVANGRDTQDGGRVVLHVVLHML